MNTFEKDAAAMFKSFINHLIDYSDAILTDVEFELNIVAKNVGEEDREHIYCAIDDVRRLISAYKSIKQ